MVNFDELKLKIKNKLSAINFSEWIFNFLVKKNRISLAIFSLAVFSYCAYLWYDYVYYPDWSEDKKQEYIESREEENVMFNRNVFEKVITETEKRKNNFQKPVENVLDIFSLE